MSETPKSPTLEKLIPVLMLATIALSFAVGVLWQKVNFVEKGTLGSAAGNSAGNQPAAPLADGKLSEDGAKAVLGASETEGLRPGLRGQDHVRGSKEAEVLIIEYSDLECPFCKQFHATVQRAVDEYDGKVAWVYRHFPLDNIHPKADREAEAVECANELGGNDGFWALVDKIFAVTPSNNGLDLDELPNYASEVGLGKEEFTSCLESGKFTDHVESDYQEGIKAGVTGTPGSYVINSKGEVWVVQGAVQYDSLKKTIDEALES